MALAYVLGVDRQPRGLPTQNNQHLSGTQKVSPSLTSPMSGIFDRIAHIRKWQILHGLNDRVKNGFGICAGCV